MTAWESILPLLVQVPLVGVFIAFVLVRDGREQASQAAREIRADAAQTKRDAEWQAFLKEQREANNGTLLRIADEMAEMSKLTTVTNALLVQHDSATREMAGRILAKVE